MLKLVLIAFSGAAVTAFAHFSGACPAILAAGQLAACSVVYGFKARAKNPPSTLELYQSYVTLAVCLFLSKLFDYWTLALAGPLASQAVFFSLPLAFFALTRLSASKPFALDRLELAMQVALFTVAPVLTLARADPVGWGILTALACLATTACYSSLFASALNKFAYAPVVNLRALTYAHAFVLAAVVSVYSMQRPASLPFFFLFVAAAGGHAAARKWYDSDEGSTGKPFAGEWGGARAALALCWAWYLYVGRSAPLVVFSLAAALYAYFFNRRSRRERAEDAAAVASSFQPSDAVAPPAATSGEPEDDSFV
jgi:hypothetical protein